MKDNLKVQFELIYYNKQELIENEVVRREAYDDINYDQFMLPKPHFVKKIDQEFQFYSLQQLQFNQTMQSRKAILDLKQERLHLLNSFKCQDPSCQISKEQSQLYLEI